MTTPAPQIEISSTQVESIGKSLAYGRELLAKAGIETAFLDARLLMQQALHCSVEQLFLNDTQPINAHANGLFFSMIERRLNREPIAKIIGRKSFWKHEFFTTKDTLDPRPETEIIIEVALNHFSPPPIGGRLGGGLGGLGALHAPSLTLPLLGRESVFHALDLGTGTGCIVLSILGEFPNATGVGADISKAALKVANKNAEALQLQDRVEFIHSDWAANIKGGYDLIVSNPPYIAEGEILPREVAHYDPASALFAGSEGLDAYRALLPRAAELLKKDGILILEIGLGQEAAVTALAHSHQLTLHEQKRDLQGIVRTLVFQKDHGKETSHDA